MCVDDFCAPIRVYSYYVCNMERRCLECGEVLSGRSDKMFCCDSCRSNWHNARERAGDADIRRINSILRRNHSILAEHLMSGKLRISAKELTDRSFNPNYFTSSGIGLIHRRLICYDIRYILMPDGSVTIKMPPDSIYAGIDFKSRIKNANLHQ